MKISEQWLREWTSPQLDTGALVAQLSMAGLEVDSAVPAAPPFEGVVVGEVVELAPHPDAERLRVAQVEVGAGERLQIVCGAPNVRLGMKAPTARVGAVLPGDLRITRARLRGVESGGMLCSARELGLAEQSEGLLALAPDCPVGADVRAVLGLDDTIIEIDLTPNRGDCLSVAGIAREVAVLNRSALRPLRVNPVAPATDADVPVELAAPAACPRYVGRVMRNVDPAAETPLWMRERLRRAGVRSLGPLVDVTNYVMLELGQPMHAFDLDTLVGGIIVRMARSGETLELLNGQTVTLDEETLVIADHEKTVALAGIMGGEQTACGDGTRNVLLESAFFAPRPIAGRARRYGLHTDSSHRFERGVDPGLQLRAMERATRLLMEIAGGEPGPVVDAVAPDHLPAAPVIRLRPERIARLIGRDYERADVEDILERLGMQVRREYSDWLVVPPGFRFDITMEADLIEEIARVDGYDNVPSHAPASAVPLAPVSESRVALERVREALIQRGYQEAITYSFVDPVFQQALDPLCTPLPLDNPISADLGVMRTTLWSGLVKAMAYNLKRQQERVRLFETGLSFRGTLADLRQEPKIAGAICGTASPPQWGVTTREVDFFDIKGDVEALLALGGEGHRYRFVAAAHPALHPGQSARIELDGRPVGWVGALHPAMEERLDLGTRTFVFELDLETVQQALKPRFEGLSRFPSSRRDLAVVVPQTVTADAVTAAIHAHGGPLLRELWLFDVYRGHGVPEGYKSLAFGLILQDFSNNLTDQAVDNTVAAIVRGLGTIGATLRT